MFPLSMNLGIIFASRLVSGNIMELLLPYLTYRYRLAAMKKSLSGDESLLTQAEREFLLDPYDVQASR